MVRYYMAEFVYQMIKARKAYGDRVILDDVTLSFLPARDQRGHHGGGMTSRRC